MKAPPKFKKGDRVVGIDENSVTFKKYGKVKEVLAISKALITLRIKFDKPTKSLKEFEAYNQDKFKKVKTGTNL